MVKCDCDCDVRERVIVSARGSVYGKFINGDHSNINYITGFKIIHSLIFQDILTIVLYSPVVLDTVDKHKVIIANSIHET